MHHRFELPPYTTSLEAVDHSAWDGARLGYFTRYLAPVLDACFEQHPWINSATICVAQYWDDEAEDAVHACVVFSVLDRPDLDAAFGAAGDDGCDDVNLPRTGGRDLGSHWEVLMRREDGSTRWAWDGDGADRWIWHDNDLAIPLFAAFCPGGGDQCAPMQESYAPWATVRRHGAALRLEAVGTMLRPWLDGVRPAWFEEHDDVDPAADVDGPTVPA